MGWMKYTSSAIAVGVLTGAGLWALADISGVAPTDATIGTTLSIDGSGFGTAKAPKVTAVPHAGGKPVTLKVTPGFTDTHVDALITKLAKGVTGEYDVTVTPGDGAAPLTLTSAFTVDVGRITTITPANPAAGDEITIDGSLFGTKKPKLKIGGKTAKVTSYSDTQVVATLHKKTPAGSQAMTLTNKLGTAEKVDAVDVGGGGGGTPGSVPRMTARLYHFNGNAGTSETQVQKTPTGFAVSGVLSGTGSDQYAVTITYPTLNLSTLPDGNSTTAPFSVQISLGGANPTAWVAIGGFTAKLSKRNGVLSAELRGDAARQGGTALPETQQNVVITFDIPVN